MFLQDYLIDLKLVLQFQLQQWLRGPLKDWAESLLDDKELKDDGYFNFKEVMNIWNLHLSGSQDMTNELWSILMFQAWRLDE